MKRIVVIFLIVFAISPCAAQWQTVALNVQIGGFGVHDTNFYEGDPSGIGRYDPWQTPPYKWVEADSGFEISPQYNIPTKFVTLGSDFFVDSRIYRLTSTGLGWSGLYAQGPLGTNGTYLFGYLQNPTAMLRSRDSGKTWDSISNINANHFLGIGRCILAATSGALYRSLDSGAPGTWSVDTTPISAINSFACLGTLIFGSNGSFSLGAKIGPIVKSTDSGSSWAEINLPGRSVSVLASTGTNLFAGTDSGVFISTDNGLNWRAVNDGLGTFLRVNALGVFDTLVFVNATDITNLGKWYTASRSIPEMVDTTKSMVATSQQRGDTLSIYPNPASGTITILSGGTSFYGVSVLNVLGEDVLDMPNLRESDITLDVSKLPSGTYFLHIEMANGSVLRKVVVQH